MLKIVDETGKTVEGKSLENYLREELTAFEASSGAGAALLTAVLSGGDEYTVTIKREAPTATAEKRVTINPAETHINDASKLADLKEFVESTIFELTNAVNSAAFAALEKGLLDGSKPLMTYGTEKAEREAEASWNVYQLLSNRTGYIPSTWGQKQIDACKGHDSLESFKAFFKTQPHENGAPANTAAGLPSQEYYAFNGAYTLGGTSKKLDNHFSNILHKKSTGKRVSLHKLMGTLPGSNMINKMNIKSVTYYHVVIDLLNTHPELTVTWKSPYKNYRFSDAMKRVAADTGDIFKTTMEKALNTTLKTLLD